MDTFAEEKSKSIEILLKARELNTLYTIKQLIDNTFSDSEETALEKVRKEVLKLIKQLKEE